VAAAGLPVDHPDLLAPVPDAIIRALQPPSPKNFVHGRSFKLPTGKIAGIVRTIARAPEGQRNRLTFWGGCRLAEMVAAGVLTDSDAVALIVEAASRNGLPHAEAHRTALSALRGAA
jgi:hypothetical protein